MRAVLLILLGSLFAGCIAIHDEPRVPATMSLLQAVEWIESGFGPVASISTTGEASEASFSSFTAVVVGPDELIQVTLYGAGSKRSLGFGEYEHLPRGQVTSTSFHGTAPAIPSGIKDPGQLDWPHHEGVVTWTLTASPAPTWTLRIFDTGEIHTRSAESGEPVPAAPTWSFLQALDETRIAFEDVRYASAQETSDLLDQPGYVFRLSRLAATTAPDATIDGKATHWWLYLANGTLASFGPAGLHWWPEVGGPMLEPLESPLLDSTDARSRTTAPLGNMELMQTSGAAYWTFEQIYGDAVEMEQIPAGKYLHLFLTGHLHEERKQPNNAVCGMAPETVAILGQNVTALRTQPRPISPAMLYRHVTIDTQDGCNHPARWLAADGPIHYLDQFVGITVTGKETWLQGEPFLPGDSTAMQINYRAAPDVWWNGTLTLENRGLWNTADVQFVRSL